MKATVKFAGVAGGGAGVIGTDDGAGVALGAGVADGVTPGVVVLEEVVGVTPLVACPASWRRGALANERLLPLA